MEPLLMEEEVPDPHSARDHEIEVWKAYIPIFGSYYEFPHGI